MHFLDLIWSIQHSLQRDKRAEASLICYTSLMLWNLQKSGLTHLAKVINTTRDFKRKKMYNAKEIEDSSGIEFCAFPPIQCGLIV